MEGEKITKLEKAPAYRWGFLALGCCSMTYFFMCIQMISCFANEAMDTLSINYTQYGWVVMALYFSYGLFNLVGGPLGSKIGSKKITILGILFAVCSTALWPLTDSYGGFLALRFIAGISGGLYIGWGLAATAVWFPARERGLAQGILVAFMGLGRSIDSYMVPILLGAGLEWRQASAVMIGVGGLIIIALYFFFCKDLKEVYPGVGLIDEILPQDINEVERFGSLEERMAKAPDTWRKTITSKPFIFMGISIGMNCIIVYALASFLPLLLTKDLGLSQETSAAVLAFTFLACLLTTPIGGVISDKFLHQKRSPIIILAFAFAIVTSILVPFTPVSLLPLVLFFCYGSIPFMNGAYWALPAEIFRPEFSGRAASVLLFIGIMFGSISNPIIGRLVDITGTNYTAMTTFVVVASVGLIATLPIMRKEYKRK